MYTASTGDDGVVGCTAGTDGRCQFVMHGIDFDQPTPQTLSVDPAVLQTTIYIEAVRVSDATLPVEVAVSACGFGGYDGLPYGPVVAVDFYTLFPDDDPTINDNSYRITNATVTISNIDVIYVWPDNVDVSTPHIKVTAPLAAVAVTFRSNTTNTFVNITDVNVTSTNIDSGYRVTPYPGSAVYVTFNGDANPVYQGQCKGLCHGDFVSTSVSVSGITAVNTAQYAADDYTEMAGAVGVSFMGNTTDTVVYVSDINATGTSNQGAGAGVVSVSFSTYYGVPRFLESSANNVTVNISKINATDSSGGDGGVVGVAFLSSSANATVSVSDISASGTAAGTGGVVAVSFFDFVCDYCYPDPPVEDARPVPHRSANGVIAKTTDTTVSEIDAAHTVTCASVAGTYYGDPCGDTAANFAATITVNCSSHANNTIQFFTPRYDYIYLPYYFGLANGSFAQHNATSSVISANFTNDERVYPPISVRANVYKNGGATDIVWNNNVKWTTTPQLPCTDAHVLRTTNPTVSISRINATGSTSTGGGGVVKVLLGNDFNFPIANSRNVSSVVTNPSIFVSEINATNIQVATEETGGGVVSVGFGGLGSVANATVAVSKLTARNVTTAHGVTCTTREDQYFGGGSIGGAVSVFFTGVLTKANVSISELSVADTQSNGGGGAVMLSFNGDLGQLDQSRASSNSRVNNTVTDVTVTMENINITHTNSSNSSGGAIFIKFVNSTRSAVKLDRLVAVDTFAGGADGGGGCLAVALIGYNNHTKLNITNSTIDRASSNAGYGGAILLFGAGGLVYDLSVSVYGSRISDPTAMFGGGRSCTFGRHVQRTLACSVSRWWDALAEHVHRTCYDGGRRRSRNKYICAWWRHLHFQWQAYSERRSCFYRQCCQGKQSKFSVVN